MTTTTDQTADFEGAEAAVKSAGSSEDAVEVTVQTEDNSTAEVNTFTVVDAPVETPIFDASALLRGELPMQAEGEVQPEKARWYIVHTYSGFEHRVEATIREKMRTGQDNGLIDEVVMPTEKVIELGKGGVKRTTTRKFYPGYIMLRMTMTDHSWHLVQSIPKVTGFVGGKNRPAPMREEEAQKILTLMESRQEQPRPKFSFDRNEEVRVIDGPFAGFNGVVEDVNYDKGKLRVSVSIFGRQTPVELDFIQVSKG